MTIEKDPEEISNIEYRYVNCAEGYGAPDNFVEIMVYESGKTEEKVIGSKDDEVLKN